MENNEALFNEKFYKFISRENKKVTARCQLCPDGDDKAIFHVTEGVSSNLVRHIRTGHKEHFKDYEDRRDLLSKSKKRKPETKSGTPAKIQKTLHHFSGELVFDNPG